MLTHWHFDPGVAASALSALGIYLYGVRTYEGRRGRSWPLARSMAFGAGVTSALVAIESPLDAAADVRFAPHMLQHLVLTDLTAPLLLLGAPLLLALGAANPPTGKRIVAALHSRLARALAFPLVTWTLFIVTLWAVHFSPFYEAALVNEPLHLVEHALFIGTALAFWLPVIAIGPTPWVEGPLAFPLRMLYVLVAMPAEAFLGFSIYGARHLMYAHYAQAGLADQQAAGEIMWIGSGFAMFAAFMLVAVEWARFEERRAQRGS